MRILHVIHSLDPRSGGPSHALRGLIAHQIAAGERVSVLTTTAQACEPWMPIEDFRRRILAEPAFDGVELFIGRSYGRQWPWSRFGYAPTCARWLGKFCQTPERRPDVVHIHGVFAHVTQLSATIARRQSVPYVIRPAGSLDPTAICLRNVLGKRVVVHAYLKRDLQQAAFVQAMSDSEAQHLRELAPAARVLMVPHGIDLPKKCSDEVVRVWHKRFPELVGKRQILFVGRLHSKKQPELLVRALSRLNGEFADLALVLAGSDAGHRGFVESEVRRTGLTDRVVFADFVQGDLKRGAFAAAAVFALPSQHENFGVAVIEAMAHGVPVLVSPHVAAHTYVDQSGAGTTAPDTVDGIVHGLRELLRQDRDSLGANGRRFVETHLTWAAIERQLARHYESAIGTTPRNRALEAAADVPVNVR